MRAAAAAAAGQAAAAAAAASGSEAAPASGPAANLDSDLAADVARDLAEVSELWGQQLAQSIGLPTLRIDQDLGEWWAGVQACFCVCHLRYEL